MPERQADDRLSSCIVIPARYASTRFPGKPLARLTGAGGVGRSLIEWSWRAAKAVPNIDKIIVATDDQRIVDEVECFGGVAMMTPLECANGTERCAAVMGLLVEKPDIVVNFQGDAPLTPPGIVAAVIARMRAEPDLAVATPAIACRGETYRHLIEDQAAGRVGGTTVVFDRQRHALYFSKNVIPYASSLKNVAANVVHLHLGIYAYRPAALSAYMQAPPSALELAEGLEQLRFLDIGVPVGAVVCEPPEGSMVELNNPTDAPLIEHELVRRAQ